MKSATLNQPPRYESCWGVSQNLQGKALSRPSSAPSHLDSLSDCVDLLDSGAMFYCLQDLGPAFRSNDPPDDCVTKLNGHDIVCSGSQEDAAGTVAILVNSAWTVTKQFRNPSLSRCLGAEIRRDGAIILVVSVYLPPVAGSSISARSSPDEAPGTSTNRSKLAIARAVTSQIRAWIRGYDCFFICGDFNQEVVQKRDGSIKGPISALLCPTSPALDVFGQLGVHEATRHRGTRRIDFMLASRDHFRVLGSSGRGWEASLSGAIQSDHLALVTSFPISFTHRPRFHPDHQVWRPDLDRATDSAKRRFHAATARLLEPLLQSPPADAEQLELAFAQVAKIIRDQAQKLLPAIRQGKRKSNAAVRVAMRKCRALRHMLTQLEKVSSGRLDVGSPAFRSAVSNLKQRGIAPAACESFSTSQWKNWSAAFADALPILTKQLVDLRSRDPLRSATSVNRLWRYGKGNRQFFQRLLRRRATIKLDSIVDPETGERSWDHNVVKEQVAQRIGSLFASRVTLPDRGSESLCIGSCGDAAAKGSVLCSDARCSGRPQWWDSVYSDCAQKPGGRELFQDIMRPADAAEMLRCLRATGAGKSPGFDLVSTDLLKILCDDGFAMDPSQKSTSASAILMLCNRSLALGIVPRHAKTGVICMIPKGSAGGSVSQIEEMRPITLLSELGKLTGRILAERVSTVLSNNPSLLHPSQRAFLKNGDTGQCIDMVLDVFEDFNRCKRPKGGQLFVASYDQAKAYDSVQQYSLECSLKRFGFPQTAVEYFCSTLTGASSSVSTAGGPSPYFPILSSVRQGDPMAPLLFVIVADALHCGYGELCADSRDPAGYTFAHGAQTQLASCGYADDVIIFAESLKALEKMHSWTRSFFGAHCFQLNPKKTVFTSSTRPPSSFRLLSVSGKSWATWTDSTASFRYLGVMISIDLDWSAELRRLSKAVASLRSSIICHGMTCASGIDAINAFLVPQIEVGIRIIPHSSTFKRCLAKWRDSLQDDLLRNQGCWFRRPNRSAFCETSGMVDFPSYASRARASIALQRLNTLPDVLPPTAWDRLAAFSPGSSWEHTFALIACRKRQSGTNRIVDALVGSGLNLRLVFNHKPHSLSPVSVIPLPRREGIRNIRPHFWDPRRDPNLLFSTPGPPQSFTIYTDGSTGLGRDAKSGYAAAIVGEGEEVVASSWMTRSGNNYNAELAAILAALTSCPESSHLTIFSDCLSGIQAISRQDTSQWRALRALRDSGSYPDLVVHPHVSEPERIRAGGRPFLTSIRKLIDKRSGTVRLCHVRSHTGQQDAHSLGNERADAAANRARKSAPPRSFHAFTWNEERIIAFIDGLHVHGDFRAWAGRSEGSQRRARWAASKGTRCARVATECPNGIAPLAALVRSRGDAEQNVLLLAALTSRLPCGFRFSRSRPPPLWSPEWWECPACDSSEAENESHILKCPATEFIWDDVLDRLSSRLGVVGESRAASPSSAELSGHDALFAQLRVRRGNQSTIRRGCWTGLVTGDRVPSDVLAAIAQAVASPRPTRILMILPASGRCDLQFHVSLANSHVSAFLFQNAAADSLDPVVNIAPSLRRDWTLKWGRFPDPCAPPPQAAITLRRRLPPQANVGLRSWLKACLMDDGAQPLASSPPLVAEALLDLQGISGYTKRLGVLPDSFVHILSHAQSIADPDSSPSLASLASLMRSVRQDLWDAAVLCIRAAHSARTWFLRDVVAGTVAAAEEALSAQRRYERRRAGPPTKRARLGIRSPCLSDPPVRASTRHRSRPKLPGFSVAWMGEYVEAPEEWSCHLRGPLSTTHLSLLRCVV